MHKESRQEQSDVEEWIEEIENICKLCNLGPFYLIYNGKTYLVHDEKPDTYH